MDLVSLVQSAQGGQAFANLGQQFGLTPQQVESAVQSLAPAISDAMKGALQNPASIGAIFSHLTDVTHQASFQNAAAAQSGGTAAAGGDILSQIFGNSDVAAEIAEKASNATGIRPDVLQEMLPVLASMVMGGIAASMHGQGLGGIVGQLGQLARDNEGSLGGLVGGMLGGTPAQGQPGAPAGQGGGIGGMLMGVVGSILSHQPAAGGTNAGAAPAMPGGLDPALVQSTLSTLTSMFQSRR